MLTVEERIKRVRNPYATEETFRTFVEDPDPTVRQWVARFTKDPALLSELEYDEDILVEFRVAGNPYLQTSSPEYYENHSAVTVRMGFAANENTPSESLGRMVFDQHEGVRRATLLNPRFKEPCVELFEEDPSTVVLTVVDPNSRENFGTTWMVGGGDLAGWEILYDHGIDTHITKHDTRLEAITGVLMCVSEYREVATEYYEEPDLSEMVSVYRNGEDELKQVLREELVSIGYSRVDVRNISKLIESGCNVEDALKVTSPVVSPSIDPLKRKPRMGM